MEREQGQGVVVTKSQLMVPGTFSIVLVKVLRSELSQGAKNAYAAIGTLIYKDRSDTEASEEEVSLQYNVSVRTFRRHLAELVKARLIKFERAGRNNRYYLLDPACAQLEHRPKMTAIEPANTGQNWPVLPEHRPEMSGVEEKHRTEMTAIEPEHRPELAGVGGGVLIPPIPPKGGIPQRTNSKKAVPRMSLDTSKIEANRTLSDELAARFLKSLEFNREDRERLLKKYSSGRIIEIERRFKIKAARGYPRKPRGLFLSMLAEDEVKPSESKAAAAEACEEHRKFKRQLEEKKASGDISTWLQGQPDKEELKKRAELHVKTFSRGGIVNRVAAEAMLRGFLWKERRKRESTPELSALGTGAREAGSG